MTFVRIVPATAALLLALAATASAQNWPGQQNQSASQSPNQSANQSPWPDQKNQVSSQSPWPGQPSAPSSWPGQNNSAAHPAWGGSAAVPARPGAQASRGQPPCADEFIPLRDDAQKKGQALQSTVEKHKTDRDKICAAFKTFVAAEAKVIKFVKDNGNRCGIPDDAAKVMKANHSKSVTMRNRVCNVAAAPSAPAAPSLSDALGTSSRLPDVSSARESKGGTFNTLSGNALAR